MAWPALLQRGCGRVAAILRGQASVAVELKADQKITNAFNLDVMRERTGRVLNGTFSSKSHVASSCKSPQTSDYIPFRPPSLLSRAHLF